MKTADQAAIRRRNLRSILFLLSHNPGFTRLDLAKATGLSLMSVTNLVEQLREQQVLAFGTARKATLGAGRRAESLHLNSERYAWLIISLTSRIPSYELYDLDFTNLLTGYAQDDCQSLQAFTARMRPRVEDALEQRRLLGVAVITPGPYDPASDSIRNQRLPELNGEKILTTLRQELGDYAYLVDEDVKFAVRSFYNPVAPTRDELLYYLYIGEGVGGALMHDGSILRGLNATTGDIGQLLHPEGDTYESHLSIDSFAEALGLSNPAGLANYAAEHPKHYQQQLMHTANTVADMLHSLLWLIDPNRIVVDCPYVFPFEDLFLRQLHNTLLERCEVVRVLPAISVAMQPQPCVLRGALAMLQKQWLEELVP